MCEKNAPTNCATNTLDSSNITKDGSRRRGQLVAKLGTCEHHGARQGCPNHQATPLPQACGLFVARHPIECLDGCPCAHAHGEGAAQQPRMCSMCTHLPRGAALRASLHEDARCACPMHDQGVLLTKAPPVHLRDASRVRVAHDQGTCRSQGLLCARPTDAQGTRPSTTL